MWSAGCILGELLLRKVLFKGISTQDQLNLIANLIGNPTEEDLISMDLPKDKIWSILQQLPVSTAPFKSTLASIFPEETNLGSIDLLLKLLVYNPKKRLTAFEALEHDFFKDLPLLREEFPIKLSSMKIDIPKMAKSFEFDDRHLNTYQLKGKNHIIFFLSLLSF
jgi:serine/threonine protein kinase